MSALTDVGRALLSYVVPLHFETVTYREALPHEAKVFGAMFIGPGDGVRTTKRWRLRFGRPTMVSQSSDLIPAPHPNCRCSFVPDSTTGSDQP